MNQSDVETIPIVALDTFSIADFMSRWQRARITSLLELFPEGAGQSEDSLIRMAATQPQDTRDHVLKNLFRNCWRLGQSTKRFFGMTWELDDFKEVLTRGSVPCLRGEWGGTKNHLALKRQGCVEGTSMGSFVCDYWREAMDGLVMGCGSDARYVRLKNKLLGDDQCEDVFFLESDAASHRYAPIPEAMLTTIAPVLQSISRMQLTIDLKGIGDGNLYYELISKPSLSCSSVPSIARTMFQQAVTKHFPHLKIVDVSPRSVLVS